MGSLGDQLYRPLHGLGVDREGGEAEGLFQDLHGEALDDEGLMHARLLPVNDAYPGKGFPIKLHHLQGSDTSQNLLSWFLWRLGSELLDCFECLGSDGTAAGLQHCTEHDARLCHEGIPLHSRLGHLLDVLGLSFDVGHLVVQEGRSRCEFSCFLDSKPEGAIDLQDEPDNFLQSFRGIFSSCVELEDSGGQSQPYAVIQRSNFLSCQSLAHFTCTYSLDVSIK